MGDLSETKRVGMEGREGGREFLGRVLWLGHSSAGSRINGNRLGGEERPNCGTGLAEIDRYAGHRRLCRCDRINTTDMRKFEILTLFTDRDRKSTSPLMSVD